MKKFVSSDLPTERPGNDSDRPTERLGSETDRTTLVRLLASEITAEVEREPVTENIFREFEAAATEVVILNQSALQKITRFFGQLKESSHRDLLPQIMSEPTMSGRLVTLMSAQLKAQGILRDFGSALHGVAEILPQAEADWTNEGKVRLWREDADRLIGTLQRESRHVDAEVTKVMAALSLNGGAMVPTVPPFVFETLKAKGQNLEAMPESHVRYLAPAVRDLVNQCLQSSSSAGLSLFSGSKQFVGDLGNSFEEKRVDLRYYSRDRQLLRDFLENLSATLTEHESNLEIIDEMIEMMPMTNLRMVLDQCDYSMLITFRNRLLTLLQKLESMPDASNGHIRRSVVHFKKLIESIKDIMKEKWDAHGYSNDVASQPSPLAPPRVPHFDE